MDDPAGIVPSLAGGHATRLAALDAEFDGTFDNGTVTVTRMGVATLEPPGAIEMASMTASLLSSRSTALWSIGLATNPDI
jgi:hypothetical protein